MRPRPRAIYTYTVNLRGGDFLTKKEFRDSLIFQLKAKNALLPCFIEMVDEYMYIRGLIADLKKEIKKEGVIRKNVYNSRGDTTFKINEATKEIRELEKHALHILKELKITTDNVISESEDDEL